MTSVLIIKLGALGDMVQASAIFKSLFNHYGNRLTLLTRSPYVDLATKLGYFQSVITDRGKSFSQTMETVREIRRAKFDCIIDLQNVDRTRLYKLLLRGSYHQWITCSNAQTKLHPRQRFHNLAQQYGWPLQDVPDLTKCAQPLNDNIFSEDDTRITVPYVLLTAGGSMAHENKKKWSLTAYIKLAQFLANNGLTPVIIGTESDEIETFATRCPYAVNLIGKTSIYQIISLGMNATFAIGNDTGPQLLIAASGCPTVTFFSAHNPKEIGGAWIWDNEMHTSLCADSLTDINVESVIAHIHARDLI